VKIYVNIRFLLAAIFPYLGLRLVGEMEGFWKDRVGKYRIIYKIDETKKEIVFYDVDLRKRVYR
jgi:mRNA-degrading endonuclease RelE of RelBE toxin-antitoxin system